MTLPSLHQPYSHRTRFKVIRSTTRLIQNSRTKVNLATSYSTVKTVTSQSIPPKSKISIAKNINQKYKWIRNSLKKIEVADRPVRIAEVPEKINKRSQSSFKLDRRILKTTHLNRDRVTKRKLQAPLSKCLVQIRGVKFHRHPNGKCLQRLASDCESTKVTGVKKVEDPVRTRANLLLQRSIQISNGRFRLRNAKKKSIKTKKICIYFNRFGKCHRGDKCPFVHDRSRIAVCTQFLNGRCNNSSCPYFHELIPGKVPTCSYFIKGACGQDNCPYAHSYVGHDAEVCEDFVQGFCAKGIECEKKHVFLCPEFEAKGQCSRGKQCHLTHRRKRNDIEQQQSKKNIDRSKIQETSSTLLDYLPAYIPLSQETQKKTIPAELKLKPSFLS